MTLAISCACFLSPAKANTELGRCVQLYMRAGFSADKSRYFCECTFEAWGLGLKFPESEIYCVDKYGKTPQGVNEKILSCEAAASRDGVPVYARRSLCECLVETEELSDDEKVRICAGRVPPI